MLWLSLIVLQKQNKTTQLPSAFACHKKNKFLRIHLVMLTVMHSAVDFCLFFSAQTSQSSFCFHQQSVKYLISSLGFICWISVASFHQKLRFVGFCTPKMSVFGHDSIIVDSFSHVWRLLCTLSDVSFWLSTFGYMFVWAIANFWQFKCHPKLCCTTKLTFLINKTNQIDWTNWTNLWKNQISQQDRKFNEKGCNGYQSQEFWIAKNQKKVEIDPEIGRGALALPSPAGMLWHWGGTPAPKFSLAVEAGGAGSLCGNPTRNRCSWTNAKSWNFLTGFLNCW